MSISTVTDSNLALFNSSTPPASLLEEFPPEILARIFWFATVHIEPQYNGYFSDWNTFAILAAVSSRWRAITHSSPCIQLYIGIRFEREIPVHFPWERLGYVELRHTSPAYALRILRLCPNLVDFDFMYNEVPGPANDLEPVVITDSGPVTIQSIQSLRWIDRAVHTPGYGSPSLIDPIFFATFRFPALRMLRWSACLPDDIPSIHAFFESMSNLSKLEFRPSSIKCHCIDQHLGLFKNITKLIVKLSDESDKGRKWLQRLTIRPGAVNLFPQLQKIQALVKDESDQPVDLDGLIVVLYSRRYHPVDWSHSSQNPCDLMLPPYDATSTHWQGHSRLMIFELIGQWRKMYVDWEKARQYSILETMIKEAKVVKGFKDYSMLPNWIYF